ncbi:MAG: tetratricopeptide repeat protein [Phenylobacterium sp.]|uniref:CHAT domain-containing tetratricopeptide repeat protein n=1 Tax=Phenylobacterium sp. TaxID=1871053 RepID=UPI001219923D|nr:CHAT domain-containing tetratricopeptide repeat protein [Phenylobacterium sp.]TAJ74841.1 MAG: tetratricopeptide repeat protein [Phenylobacterium sp.]
MRPRVRRAGLTAVALLCIIACPGASAFAAGAPASPRALTAKETAAWQTLVVEAEAARAASQWRRLEQVTRKRVAIELRAYGPDAPVTAVSWSWIGQALVRQGRDADAEPFYRRALGVDRKALGDRDPQTLLAISNLAGVLERRGRFAEAEPLRRDLLTASRALFGPRSAEAAAAIVALADVMRAQSKPREAEPLYRLAAEIDLRLLGDKDPGVAADMGALAATLDELGRHVEAEPLHRRSLAIRREVFGERDAATAQAYARMGSNLDAQGRHGEAEPLLRLALATDEDVRGSGHPATAADAAALGANLDAQRRTDEAGPLLRRALEVRRKALGEKHADTGASYGALGDNLAARGKHAEAERLHRRALAIVRAAKGEDNLATAQAYAGLAADLSARGRYAEAEPMLRKALEVRRTELGERHPTTAAAYDALAENQHHLAANTGAEQLSSRAVAIVRARRSADLSAAGSDPEAAIRRARADGETGQAAEPVFRRYLRLAWLASREQPAELPRLQDQAFTAAQDLEVSPAARALAQTAARAAFTRKAAAGDARVRQALAGEVRQIEGQLARALPQDDPAKAARVGAALDAVGRELAGLDARLQKDNPKYAETIAPPALTVIQAQKRLRPGEGMLFIVPTGQDVHVFALSRTRVLWNRIEGGQPELEARIRALRCQVDDGACGGKGRPILDGHVAPFDLQIAYSLYRDLIGPVESALGGVDRLFVTTSGAFGSLPLGLLPTTAPQGGGTGAQSLAATSWLADRYALTTLPSVASLRTTAPSKRPASQRWAFVGYGDPTIGGISAWTARSGETKPVFAPLPGTADELRAMARTLGAPQTTVRLGGRATEAAIKTSPDIAKAGVVAIATHGLLSHELAGLDEPGLVLTPPGKATAEDDGVLTASEAAALDLSADWVILSACNTAGSDGAPGADSLSGLARAFLYAGARALLVSHWRVFDDATAALTVQTLAIQKANPRLSKAQALQQAMRTVRTGRRPDGSALPGWRPEWAHPAYWAPFVVITADG